MPCQSKMLKRPSVRVRDAPVIMAWLRTLLPVLPDVFLPFWVCHICLFRCILRWHRRNHCALFCRCRRFLNHRFFGAVGGAIGAIFSGSISSGSVCSSTSRPFAGLITSPWRRNSSRQSSLFPKSPSTIVPARPAYQSGNAMMGIFHTGESNGAMMQLKAMTMETIKEWWGWPRPRRRFCFPAIPSGRPDAPLPRGCRSRAGGVPPPAFLPGWI